MSISIGIDFGTSKTLVAWMHPETGQPTIIRMGDSRDEIPTTIYLPEDGEMLYGDAADAAVGTDVDTDGKPLFDYSKYKRGFKLKLGSDKSLIVGTTRGYSARDLTRKFLKYIKDRCETEAVGEKITSVVLTVPAVFEAAQRDDLEKAAKDAGFYNVELLSEPIAAGMAYCRMFPKNASEGNFLVADWGGGTLDLAIVSRGKDGSFDELQGLVDGCSDIGGEAMDEAMWRLVAELFSAKPGEFDLTLEPPDRQGAHKVAIRRAKEMLSTHDKRPVSLATPQGAKAVMVLRKDFESQITPLVERGVSKARELIEKARLENQIPIFTLLVGGTCKVPLVKQEIESSTKTDCRPWQYSREAVAFGAAIKAGVQAKPSHPITEPPVQKAEEDATTWTCPKCAEVGAWNPNYQRYICSCWWSPPQADLPKADEKDDEKRYWLFVAGEVDPLEKTKKQLAAYSSTPGAMFCEVGSTEWKPAYLLDTVPCHDKTKQSQPTVSRIPPQESRRQEELQSHACKVYVRPAVLGRIIRAPEAHERHDTDDKAIAFFNAHTTPCFLELVVENKTAAPLSSPRLTCTNKKRKPTPHFLQMEDIPAHESRSYNSHNLNWIITLGDEICVEFANLPGAKAGVKVTSIDIAATWPQNKMALRPLPVIVTWRRGFWKGAVLSIANITDYKLVGLTICTSAGDATSKHNIERYGTLEIGSEELAGGRNLQGGDVFSIEARNYLQVAGFVMDEGGTSQEESGLWKVLKVAGAIGLGAAGISLGG